MRNVALMGRAGAGKDTVAGILAERWGHVRVAFADPLRRMALAVDPIITSYKDSQGIAHFRLSELVDVHGWDGAKRAFPEVRRFLQRLGSEGVRDTLGPDTWVRTAHREVWAAWQTDRPVVLTDVRFPNEVAYAKRHGFMVVWIDRPGVYQGEHASEHAVTPDDADVVVYNGGDLTDLAARVSLAVHGRLDADAGGSQVN